jgi:synaptic vesicle membrane protein VAT-1
MVMYGLSEGSKEGARDLPTALRSLLKMPLATMPWWKSLTMMNENKGVFGLNMLSWWDREGNLDRVTAPLLADLEAGRIEPIVAESFSFDRAGEAHEFIAQRRNVGKVVLFP